MNIREGKCALNSVHVDDVVAVVVVGASVNEPDESCSIMVDNDVDLGCGVSLISLSSRLIS